MADAVRWADLYTARRAAAQRWPDAFRLPVRRTPGRVVASVCNGAATVLDVGAGARRLKESLARHAPAAVYHSMDADRETPQDFHDLADVPAPIQVAALLEVIEHVSLADGLALLRDIRSRLEPGGCLVVSTPAIHTPGRFLRDATHCTPYAHDELAGLCEMAGFRVEQVLRTYNAPAVARFVRLWIAHPFHRYFGVDYAHSIVVVARNASS